MNLHNIRVSPSRLYMWLGVESRRTWRETSKHIWQIPLEPGIPAIEEWNQNRPPAAVCGYHPRTRTMHLNTYSYRYRCEGCRTYERNHDILVVSYTQALQLASMR